MLDRERSGGQPARAEPARAPVEACPVAPGIPLAALTPSMMLYLQRSVGNAVLARQIPQDPAGDAPLQELAPFRSRAFARAPQGLQETPFGSYWVHADNEPVQPHAGNDEVLTASEFREIEDAYQSISGGRGSVQIRDHYERPPGATSGPDRGPPFPAFRGQTLARIGLLLSAPVGRRLVLGLVSGGQPVVIQPYYTSPWRRGAESAREDVPASRPSPEGTPGRGSGTVVTVDPTLTDTSMVVHGPGGVEIDDPVYIVLGHELIHARHNARGTNASAEAPFFPANDNREEENTIGQPSGPRGDEPSEDDLRREHNVPRRFGHSGGTPGPSGQTRASQYR